MINEPVFNALPTRKCPHLGLYEDTTTWSATEQMQNYCHFRRPEMVAWAHQCQYCFTADYTACPLLSQSKPTVRSPRRTDSARWVVGLLLLVAVLTAVVIGVGKTGRAALYDSVQASQPTVNLLASAESSNSISQRAAAIILQLTPTITPTEEAASPSPSRTAPVHKTARFETAVPSATVYHTPTSGPGLSTPFGTQSIYIVHHVLAGETLEMLARQYDTSEAVLRAVNNLAPTAVLWLDVNIVVLPGVKQPNGIQARQAVYLEWNTTVRDLVAIYKVSAAQLRADNGLSSDEQLPGKRWLVLPITP